MIKSICPILFLLFVLINISCDDANKKKLATSPWGVASHPTVNREWQHIDTLMSRAQNAGIKWMREDFAFGSIYNSKENYHFARYDSLLDIAEKHGIQILPILEGFDHEVARNNPQLVPLYNHPEEWRQFVRKTVQRYHKRIKHWEIWNEQDGGFWKPVPNAAQYVKLLKIAHEEIKQIDPTCKVITGGMIAWNAGYLEAMYNEGAKDYFDIVAVHPYGFGPDVNMKAKRMRSEVLDVIRKYETKHVPIWISEFGGTSFQGQLAMQQKDYVLQAMRYALDKIGNDPKGELTIGLAVSPRVMSPNELITTRSWLPGVNLKLVTLEQLSTLDPAKCQVLIGAEGLNIDKPLIEPLRKYVERGGLLFGANKVPFNTIHYQDENGAWLQKDTPDEFYMPHKLNFEAHWTKKGIPAHTNEVLTSLNALEFGLPEVSNIYVDRFLDGSRMQAKDKYYPIIQAFHNGKSIGDGMGLYTYNDWKGGVLLSTISVDTGYSEEGQANLLQRIYLTYLSMGVEKLFWYDLHNDGELQGEREHNFGLLNFDFTPKKAYHAYKELTDYLGESPTFVKRIEGTNDETWALVYKNNETKQDILTAWSIKGIDSIRIIKDGKEAKIEISDQKVLFLPFKDVQSVIF